MNDEVNVGKSLLISIRPKWIELINSGKKTVEVRKNVPNDLWAPYRCFVYCTKPKFKARKNDSVAFFWGPYSGMVIGEFVCDHIVRYNKNDVGLGLLKRRSCVPKEELLKYVGTGTHLFGWHISEWKLYDNPRPISSFGLKRPPQSWVYVEKEAT